jgi:hypothetical protein
VPGAAGATYNRGGSDGADIAITRRAAMPRG